MQDVIQSMTTMMELKGFAKSTQRNYLAHIRRFHAFCGQPLVSVGYEEVRAFLHHAITIRKLSAQFVNCAYSAIKFLYQSVLQREWNMIHVPRVKKPFKLPAILTPQEVHRILEATPNLKHRAMLSTVYSAGLRVSEVTHLRISDIHSHSMRLLIRQAKGRKDRFTLLSEKNLLLLRQYWKAYRPKDWLFPGVPEDKPLATRSIQAVFQKSKAAAGISKPASIHTLRHCFATHLLQNGAELLQIKNLLGHADIQSTTVYLHLTDAQVLGLKSPFDRPYGGDDHD